MNNLLLEVEQFLLMTVSKELAMEWVFEEKWKWRYVMGRERGAIVYLKKPKYVLALRQSNSVLIISRFSVFALGK